MRLYHEHTIINTKIREALLAFVQAWSDGLSLSDEQTAEILEAMAAGLRSG